MGNQGYLFDDIEIFSPRKKKTKAEFCDYDSFVKKFTDSPKTTDDCYTPRDVYEEVLNYVNTICPLEGKKIIRPFYPGSDYENCEYPDDGVVIDNPPFSILSSIIKFYVGEGVKFFLFSPALTCTNNADICTAVVANADIVYTNGAIVKTNFVTNLLPDDILLITAPELKRNLERLRPRKARLLKNVYPRNVLGVAEMHQLANGGERFVVKRSEARLIRHLDGLHKSLFGKYLLVCDQKAEEFAAAKARADAAKAMEAEKAAIVIELSERERGIVKELSVALLEHLVKTYTNEGETVLDNTMGSGSTGVACVNTGRAFIGIEKDDHYFEIAAKRIEDAKKEKAAELDFTM